MIRLARERKRDSWKGAAAGAAGGIAGGLIMDLFRFAWDGAAAEAAPKRAAVPLAGGRVLEFPKEGVTPRVRKRKRREREQARAEAAAGRFAGRLMGGKLDDGSEQAVDAGLRLVLMGLIGAGYGLAVENLGDDGRKHGVSFGAAAVLTTDEMTGAVVGRQSGGSQEPFAANARKLGAGVAFALALETVRGFVRKALD